MFNFGIFSTHMPYAVLVLFYFFLILNGFTRKPCGSEFTPDEMRQHRVVVSSAPAFNAEIPYVFEKVGHPDYSGFDFFSRHFLPDKRLKYTLTDVPFSDRLSFNPFFNRPPPEA